MYKSFKIFWCYMKRQQIIRIEKQKKLVENRGSI